MVNMNAEEFRKAAHAAIEESMIYQAPNLSKRRANSRKYSHRLL